MKNRNISFILLLFITSFLISNTFIVNSNALETDVLEYKFEKNTLFDDFNSLDKDIVNLRHNNIITNDYNGTYSFADDTIGSIPKGWINDSNNNAKAQIQDYYNNHKKILNLKVIDSGDAIIKQTFDDGEQISGIIELWMITTNAEYSSYILIYDNDVLKLNFRILADEFQWNNGTWQLLNTSPMDNIWYHIRFELDCISDSVDIYIDNNYEGNFAFQVLLDNFDELRFNVNSDVYYETNFDAVGFSWTSNYTIGENKYPIIEIVDSDILSNDKYEFNLNNTHTPYNTSLADPIIYGWEQEGNNKMDTPNPDAKSKNINGIYQIGSEFGSFIRNDTLGILGDRINITFGLQILEMEESYSEYHILVSSLDDTQIIQMKLDPIVESNTLEIEYDPTGMAPHIVLGNITHINPNDVYNFNLYIENFEVRLIWYKNDVYNDTYIFPLIINKTGINEIYIINDDAQDGDNEDFITRLNYVGIYQYNISLSWEKGFLRYDFNKDWKFNKNNLFSFSSNYYIRIIAYSPSTDFFYIFRGFDNQDFFVNLHDNLVVDEGLTIINSSLCLIIYENINLNEYLFFSIEGVKIDKYVNGIFVYEKQVKFYYHNVDKENSYHYVDNNKLYYRLDMTQNDTSEYIALYFDFARHILSNNRSVHFKCKKTSTNVGVDYIDIAYYQPPNFHYEFKTYLTSIETQLVIGKELSRFYLISSDFDNNDFTGFVSSGFVYNLGFGHIPTEILPIPIITLSLIAIMIPLIILIVPTLGVYSVYRKKEIIVPMLLLMSIICFVSNIIPLQLFFVMILCFASIIFIQYKRGFNPE